MDYRHDLRTKEETLEHQFKVPQIPKQFFSLDDGTRFVPGKNKDVKLN